MLEAQVSALRDTSTVQAQQAAAASQELASVRRELAAARARLAALGVVEPMSSVGGRRPESPVSQVEADAEELAAVAADMADAGDMVEELRDRALVRAPGDTAAALSASRHSRLLTPGDRPGAQRMLASVRVSNEAAAAREAELMAALQAAKARCRAVAALSSHDSREPRAARPRSQAEAAELRRELGTGAVHAPVFGSPLSVGPSPSGPLGSSSAGSPAAATPGGSVDDGRRDGGASASAAVVLDEPDELEESGSPRSGVSGSSSAVAARQSTRMDFTLM